VLKNSIKTKCKLPSGNKTLTNAYDVIRDDIILNTRRKISMNKIRRHQICLKS